MKIIIKYIVGILYLILFYAISLAMFAATLFLVTLFSVYIYNIIEYREKIAIVVLIISGMYSSWLARESSINFADNNCLFLEAIKFSISKSKMYLSFVPIIGPVFSKNFE